MTSVTIQGELGSNSHAAALAMLPGIHVVPCARSGDALSLVLAGQVDGAVLPIENTLHGSVVEHYDLLLDRPVRLVGESQLRIGHCLLAKPGTSLSDLRFVLSHPVALSQCRRWLEEHPKLVPNPFYDTAGSLKHIMEGRLADSAAIAPRLAADVYGGSVLEEGLEDHPDNFTRFHLIVREAEAVRVARNAQQRPSDKMTLAFSVEHRPASLVRALDAMARAGADLTRIESRPVHGRPWEYVFYVDFRFGEASDADKILEALRGHCGMLKELGRYAAAR